jgi:hypothetical protein
MLGEISVFGRGAFKLRAPLFRDAPRVYGKTRVEGGGARGPYLPKFSFKAAIRSSASSAIFCVSAISASVVRASPGRLRRRVDLSKKLPTLLRRRIDLSKKLPTLLRRRIDLNKKLPTLLRRRIDLNKKLPTLLRRRGELREEHPIFPRRRGELREEHPIFPRRRGELREEHLAAH